MPEDLKKNIKLGIASILGLGRIKYKIINGTKNNNAHKPSGLPIFIGPKDNGIFSVSFLVY